VMERHLVCCGCGHTEESERLNCPKCNCELKINLEYYLNHISELEGVYINYKKTVEDNKIDEYEEVE